MTEKCFRVGDRVQISASTILPVGRIGIIVRSFVGEDDLYDVQFDGERCHHLTLSSELELRPRSLSPAGPVSKRSAHSRSGVQD